MANGPEAAALRQRDLRCQAQDSRCTTPSSLWVDTAGLHRKVVMAFRLEDSQARTTRVRSAPQVVLTLVPWAPRAMDGVAEACRSSPGNSNRWMASLNSGSAVEVEVELGAAALAALALSRTDRRPSAVRVA